MGKGHPPNTNKTENKKDQLNPRENHGHFSSFDFGKEVSAKERNLKNKEKHGQQLQDLNVNKSTVREALKTRTLYELKMACRIGREKRDDPTVRNLGGLLAALLRDPYGLADEYEAHKQRLVFAKERIAKQRKPKKKKSPEEREDDRRLAQSLRLGAENEKAHVRERNKYVVVSTDNGFKKRRRRKGETAQDSPGCVSGGLCGEDDE